MHKYIHEQGQLVKWPLDKVSLFMPIILHGGPKKNIDFSFLQVQTCELEKLSNTNKKVQKN